MEIMARGKKRSSFFFENEIDGRTDGRTNLLIEMCGRIQKYNNNDNDNTMTMKTTTTTNLEHEGEFQRFVKSAWLSGDNSTEEKSNGDGRKNYSAKKIDVGWRSAEDVDEELGEEDAEGVELKRRGVGKSWGGVGGI